MTFQCRTCGLKDFLVCRYLWGSPFTPVNQGLSSAEAVETWCQRMSRRPLRGCVVSPQNADLLASPLSPLSFGRGTGQRVLSGPRRACTPRAVAPAS